MSKNAWLWILSIFLLMTLLVGAWLDIDGLWYDEVFTVKNAGGAQYGPLSPLGIYESVKDDDPYQAIGYPMTIALWGALVGWSEFATRLSSLLFSLVTMALIYRLGKDTVSEKVGILAALIYAVSSFTIFYAHELRAFSFTALFAAWLLWAYLRLLQKGDNLGRISFFLSATGLLYAHYYGAMLLIGLGLYQLIFVKKNRLWFEIVGLAILVAIAFLPQFDAFREGLTRYDPNNVSKAPLTAWEALLSIVYYIGNNNLILTSLALIAGLIYAFRPNTKPESSPINIYRALLIILFFSLIILLISNELLDILEPARLRYAIFLWPLLALCLGAGLNYLADIAGIYGKLFGLALFLLLAAVWLGNGLWAYFTPDFNASIAGTETPRFRTITNVMRTDGMPSDLFAFYNGRSNQAWYVLFTLNYSVADLPMPTILTASLYDRNESTRIWAAEQINAATRVWYGQNRTFELNEVHEDFLALLNEQFVQCYVAVDNAEMGLELYARSEAFCPSDDNLLSFGGFSLSGYEQSQNEDNLELALGWEIAADVPPQTYSLAVHLIPKGAEAPSLQADLGFNHAAFMPMNFNFDLSQIPSGEYEIWLIVYDWQTGIRLQGQNTNGETGERLLVGSLSVD